MTLDDILKELKLRGYSTNAAVTQQTLYSKISADQLYSNTNRLNAGWGRGKIILATFSNAHSKSDFIAKWKELVGKYQDQFLCLEVSNSPSTWEFYDWQGMQINFSDIFPTITSSTDNPPLQTIFYGAPGTGKSYKVNELTKGDDTVIRTTFHPDSDYASFVGCYKPVTKEDKPLMQVVADFATRQAISIPVLDSAGNTVYDTSITYQFTQQAFLKAYIQAWKKLKDAVIGTNPGFIPGKAGAPIKKLEDSNLESERTEEEFDEHFTEETVPPVNITGGTTETYLMCKQQYLVIEEINRGNCAQIFGDIFQLLDRNDAGFSTYPIVPDADITKELKKVFENLDLSSVENYINGIFSENYPGRIVDKIKSGELLVLPCNLKLLATMNTSDQSLFPMDSAFKRRWDWEFVPIRYSATEAKDDKDNFHTFEIEIGDKKYKWIDFLEKINAKILSVTDSEDKQMGEYFIKKNINQDEFINKVMYYLWSEVGKDMYNTTNALFTLPEDYKDKDGKAQNQFSFNELFKENATDLLIGFMKKLEVKSEEEKAAEKAATPTPATPAEV